MEMSEYMNMPSFTDLSMGLNLGTVRNRVADFWKEIKYSMAERCGDYFESYDITDLSIEFDKNLFVELYDVLLKKVANNNVDNNMWGNLLTEDNKSFNENAVKQLTDSVVDDCIYNVKVVFTAKTKSKILSAQLLDKSKDRIPYETKQLENDKYETEFEGFAANMNSGIWMAVNKQDWAKHAKFVEFINKIIKTIALENCFPDEGNISKFAEFPESALRVILKSKSFSEVEIDQVLAEKDVEAKQALIYSIERPKLKTRTKKFAGK